MTAFTNALRTYGRPKLEVGTYPCPRCGAEIEVVARTASIRCPNCFEDIVVSTRIIARP